MTATNDIAELLALKAALAPSGTVYHGNLVPIDEETTKGIELPNPMRPAALDSVRVRRALQKIDELLGSLDAKIAGGEDFDTALDVLKAEILGAASGSADTLQELEHLIGVANSTLAALAAADPVLQDSIDEKVSFEIDQSLTDEQQSQARKNVFASPFDPMAFFGIQVNGFLQVSQEHGFDTELANGGYTSDQEFGGNAVVRLSCVGGVNNPLPSERATRLRANTARASYGAGDFDYVSQRIEGERVQNLFWGTPAAIPITIARVIQADVSGRIYLSVRDPAAWTYSYLVPFDLVAGVPQLCKATIPGPTSGGTWPVDASRSLEISWCFGTGSSFHSPSIGAWTEGSFTGAADGDISFFASVENTAYLGPWVIIPGNQGPNTIDQLLRCQRPIEHEFRTCERYYQTLGNGHLYYGTHSNAISNSRVWFHSFRTPMRDVPVLEFIDAGTSGAGGYNSISMSKFDFQLIKNFGNSTQSYYVKHLVFNARM